MARSAHAFTADDDATLARAASGTISITQARGIIGCSYDAAIYRMNCLGMRVPVKKVAPEPVEVPTVRDGWIAIAHKSNRKWVPLEGAPISIDAAQMATDAGRGTMAHRRVDGGFDLMFRVLR